MPGLLVAVADGRVPVEEDRLSRAFAALDSGGEHHSESMSQNGFYVGQVRRSPFGHHYFESPDGIATWIYGAIYLKVGSVESVADKSQTARDVCRQYQQLGLRFIDELNGEFNLVLWDKNQGRLIIGNDRFGIRPWYTLTLDWGTVLSPGVRGLLPFIERGPQLDLDMLVAFLSFNKMRLAGRTLVEGVHVLPGGSIWTVDLASGHIEKRVYYQFRYDDSMTSIPVADRIVDDLIDCYRRVMTVRSQMGPDTRVGISLSGGLDSRSMVGALEPGCRHAVSAHTYGLPESDEVQLAAQVARTAGVPHVLHPLSADDFVANAQIGMQLNDELDIFVQGAQAVWLERASKQIDVIMTGIDLDVTLGGIYLVPEVLQARNDADVGDLLAQRNRVFTKEHLRQLLTPTLWQKAGEAPYEMVRDLVAEIPQETPAAKYDMFIHLYSMRRIIMLRYAMHRHWVETSSPMYDYDFIDLISAIPTSQRAGHRTFTRFLNRLTPELASLPYQRTMLPATAPVEFWESSARLERQREQLYFDIWRETNGRVFIPYRRYYTNFDEWLRLSPAWIQLTDDLLRSRESMLYQLDLVEPKSVETLIEQHRTGQRERRSELICLMSLELYLREYFS